MGDIRVRNVKEEVVSALRAQARRHGRTLSDELRAVLETEASRKRLEVLDGLEAFVGAVQAETGVLPDSTPGIRAERDLRG